MFDLYRQNRITEDRKRQTVERIKERARLRAKQADEDAIKKKVQNKG